MKTATFVNDGDDERSIGDDLNFVGDDWQIHGEMEPLVHGRPNSMRPCSYTSWFEQQ